MRVMILSFLTKLVKGGSMKGFWMAVWDILKGLDWKKTLYEFYANELKPVLEEKVKATESKWDDAALNAADLLIDKFVKPSN